MLPSLQFASVPVRDLRPGDIVFCYGMHVLVTDMPVKSLSHPDRNGGCYWTDGVVVNIDEVRAAGFVPMSFLYRSPDYGPRWALQGNDLGTVYRARVVGDPNVVATVTAALAK